MGLESHVSEVHHYGIRGGLSRNFPIPVTLLDQLKPVVVIIDLGTNDLARAKLSPSQVLKVAMDIIKMGKVLIDKAGVTHVVVCSCLNRIITLKTSPQLHLKQIWDISTPHWQHSANLKLIFHITHTKGSGEISIKNHSK